MPYCQGWSCLRVDYRVTRAPPRKTERGASTNRCQPARALGRTTTLVVAGRSMLRLGRVGRASKDNSWVYFHAQDAGSQR